MNPKLNKLVLASGFDVCDALKADPPLADIPVIFATSHADTLLHLAALDRGVADFIAKPVVAAQLTARVRARLRARQIVSDLKRDVPAPSADRATGVAAARILIVDDDISSIEVLRRNVAGMGDLHFAKSGLGAVALARRLLPDLILLDAHMPGLDGFEVCKALKAEATFRHVPIVFVTRFSDPCHETRALDLGAADFIAKPYTGAVLQDRVRILLELKRRTAADLLAVSKRWRRVGDARVADIVAAASDAIVTYNAEETVVLIKAAVAGCSGWRTSSRSARPSGLCSERIRRRWAHFRRAHPEPSWSGPTAIALRSRCRCRGSVRWPTS